MIYRPLGRTGLTLSAVGLGGHWRTVDGQRYYEQFVDDVPPAEVLANRDEVVGLCLDAGVNYIDITTAAECVAYGRVLGSRRDRLIIGADDYQWSARNRASLSVDSLVAAVERCLGRLRTDRLDLWRVTSEVHGQNTDAELQTVIEAAHRLRRAGKIRHLGLSTHHPGWIVRVLSVFGQPQATPMHIPHSFRSERDGAPAFGEFEAVLMPAMPMHIPHPFRNERDGAPNRTPGRIPDRTPGGGISNDIAGRAFETAEASQVGVIGIKPFAGGLLFAPGEDEANERAARLALQQALDRPVLTSVVPGMSTADEARNLLAAVTAPLPAPDELDWLARRIRQQLGTLPPEYLWLADWNTGHNALNPQE